MSEKSCFNCKWMFIMDEAFYCVSELRRRMNHSVFHGDASCCTGWSLRPFVKRKILIEFQASDNDSANRLHDLIKHLIKKNIDGRFITKATSRIITEKR